MDLSQCDTAYLREAVDRYDSKIAGMLPGPARDWESRQRGILATEIERREQSGRAWMDAAESNRTGGRSE